jgi:FtsZ-binding cell division protein ZapB
MVDDLPDFDADLPKRSAKPSGHQNLIKRRAKQQARQKAHRERLEADGVPVFKPVDCSDVTRIHLLELQRLWEAQELLVSDPSVSTEDKADFIVKIASAIAKINVHAQVVAKQDIYVERLQKEIDGLTTERRELELQRKQLEAAVAAFEDERRAWREQHVIPAAALPQPQ